MITECRAVTAGAGAGVFYLLTIVSGALALFVKEPLRSAMLLAFDRVLYRCNRAFLLAVPACQP
jgi:hypothetical protein